MKIGVIGLGQMGAAMARNLLAAGHEVIVWNRDAAKAAPLVARGATLAATPAEAAAGGLVISMLADDRAVEAVTLGQGGLLSADMPGLVHLSMSTISPALSARLAGEHAKAGGHYVGAPVFGRPPAAEAGKLFIVVAGAADAVAKAEPVLSALGQRQFVVGEEPSAAHLVKLCGNFMLVSTVEALGEAMAAAHKGGVPRAALLEVLNNSIFPGAIYKIYGDMIAAQTFRPAGFTAALGLKDMGLMSDAADGLGAALPLLDLVKGHLAEVVEKEGADIDLAGMSLAAQYKG
ncbi:NAD(P)-dependent oxidoreductase [Radicibacter daui]|uniref:NAD(P)-dependent oxidoreductase n=1 Tax=Radicibacter daui TaxID=3064829 RepID=UPI004046B0FF